MYFVTSPSGVYALAFDIWEAFVDDKIKTNGMNSETADFASGPPLGELETYTSSLILAYSLHYMKTTST